MPPEFQNLRRSNGAFALAPARSVADKVKSGTDIRGGSFPEDAVVENTEILMTLDEARRLVALLTEAIESQGG
jgi:hypothetical protein